MQVANVRCSLGDPCSLQNGIAMTCYAIPASVVHATVTEASLMIALQCGLGMML